MANKERDVIRFSNDTASLTPNKDVDTTCLVPSENVFSEVVEKVSDIDNTAQKYARYIKILKNASGISWVVTGIVTIICLLVMYCASAYVNKVEQRYASYKENVEQRLDNYEKRFDDLKEYCIISVKNKK